MQGMFDEAAKQMNLYGDASKETVGFVQYKWMVAEVAGLPEYKVREFSLRIGAAFDMGEPVWMIADELRLRAQAPTKTKTPRQLAARVYRA